MAAYQSSEAGLLPHTLWQSTNGQVGANRTNWSGCGFVDTSIYHGTLASLSSLGWHPPDRLSAPPIEEEEEEEDMQIQNDRKFGAVSFARGQFKWISFFCDPGGEGKTPNRLRARRQNSDPGPSNRDTNSPRTVQCTDRNGRVPGLPGAGGTEDLAWRLSPGTQGREGA